MLLAGISLETDRLFLRSLTVADATATYAAWLQNPAVNRFLEVRFAPPRTLNDLARFIDGVNSSKDELLLGIFVKSDGRHIGNIKLGPVNFPHARADIGLLIGDAAEWGKGLAREAIAAITEYGFRELKLRKITAGCYAANIGSYRAFLAAGFHEEARLPKHWTEDDEILLARHAPDDETVRFDAVENIVLIGGGAVLKDLAGLARRAGFDVQIVLAPRHAAERDDSGADMANALRGAGYSVEIVEDINVAKPPGAGPRALAFCVGPAWIFSAATRAAFGAGMYNLNLIPIPHYLGGAHFTWQILNRDRQGGCFFQEITEKLDRGPVLRLHRFELPETARLPADYFQIVMREALIFCGQLFDDFKAGRSFRRVPFSTFEPERLYFPRLLTADNGWIDWSWTADEVLRFCQAFDDPYLGASTAHMDRIVRLRDVSLEPGIGEDFHPFAAGLIVRKFGGRIFVAAKGGVLCVRKVVDENGADAMSGLKEGSRFVTSIERLTNARGFRPVIGAKR